MYNQRLYRTTAEPLLLLSICNQSDRTGKDGYCVADQYNSIAPTQEAFKRLGVAAVRRILEAGITHFFKHFLKLTLD